MDEDWLAVSGGTPKAAKTSDNGLIGNVSEENAMVVCDLCGQKTECFQRGIEGKEYDICSDCWTPLAKKLEGKGKMKEDPRPSLVTQPEESPALPGDH